MSKQEIREEMKESEGSPQVRSRIRGLQRQMRRERPVHAQRGRHVGLADPPEHDVVLAGEIDDIVDVLQWIVPHVEAWPDRQIEVGQRLDRRAQRDVDVELAGRPVVAVGLGQAEPHALARIGRQVEVAEHARPQAQRRATASA